ncbi:MAG TPA: ABC transporter substrate-binding protein [Acetobacteraceae bacterium]|jgi:multiple sugar transport system substrate-binding protein|nr:ABC transporter substrate-binding protein [Acetobacteraceae bacterium]HTD28925.1 ABC transporter substrate-binding protein [Xanthomonadaceae bacterium]
MSRRTVLRGSLGVAATGLLTRPYIANAAASTATVWQVQGFVPEEDAAFRKTVTDYEKASGNNIDLSIMPFTALNQKVISALTSGEVPDLVFHDAPATILPQNAWENKLEDVSDIVEAHRSELSKTSVLASSFYNSVTKQRAFYLIPIKQGCEPFHIWGDLVEQAGFKLSDAPKTWDAFWDFFKPMQQVLRSKGRRKLYALGLQITTVGPNDGNGLFGHFLFANGGENMVTPDGKLHTDDPQVREAAIRSVEYMTNCYKGGYVPPEALSWNDADDNNAYHEKLILMDLDGTLSTELAMVHDKQAFEAMVTMALPNGNDGKPMPALQAAGGGFIPKGARNVAVAKDFMKFFIQPQVMNENLKQGLGRWVPVIPSLVTSDPFWLDTKDPHLAPYVREAVLGPTMPSYNGYNPAWGQVSAEQLWGVAHADVIKNGMTPAAAIDKAFKRADAIFAKYTFG